MNPFIAIDNFIKTQLFAKYPILGACYMHSDEEDPRYKDYYIKYKVELTFEEIWDLQYNIICDVSKFCKENNFQEAYDHLSIMVSRLV